MIKQAIHICYSEFCALVRDPGLLLFGLIVPLVYPLLYAYIYTNEVVRDVPIVVVDDSKSSLSREFTRRFDAAADVQVVAVAPTLDQARQLLREHKAYGILHIPESLSDDVWHRRTSTIGLYSDMSSMLQYKGMLLAASNASLDLNREIRARRDVAATTDREEGVALTPIAYEHVQLYNPQGGFAAFLIPPVLMLILQQTLLLCLGMSMGRYRERRLFTDAGPAPIFLGKGLTYFTLYMVMATYMYAVVTWMFGLPHLGHFTLYLLFAAIFIAACIALGMLLSRLIYRREDCILLYVFMSVPLLFLSGVSWPGAAMPQGWQWFSWLFPSTFGCRGYIALNTYGATMATIWPLLRALLIQAIAYGTLFLVTTRHPVAQPARRR